MTLISNKGSILRRILDLEYFLVPIFLIGLINCPQNIKKIRKLHFYQAMPLYSGFAIIFGFHLPLYSGLLIIGASHSPQPGALSHSGFGINGASNSPTIYILSDIFCIHITYHPFHHPNLLVLQCLGQESFEVDLRANHLALMH